MVEPIYDIKGPGLVRAIQRAVSLKKDIGIVYDKDNTGHLLRVGYFYKEKNNPDLTKHPITWFSPDEIEITVRNTNTREFGEAFLDIEFSHPKENERHFILFVTLDKETRIILRNVFRIERKSVVGFMTQVEIRCNTEGKELWKPVVRYDHAHGFIHRDMIASDGSKTKNELGSQNTKDAIVIAINEIQQNLNVWLSQLGYSVLSEEVLNQSLLYTELEKAKTKLLELHDNPGKIKTVQSTFGQLKERPDYKQML